MAGPAPRADAAAEQAARAAFPAWLVAAERAVGLITRAAFGLAVLLVLMDLCLLGLSVTARYLLNAPIVWSDEIVALSLTAITMLAAPRVLLERGHIEVDILTSAARGRLALAIRLWGSAAVAAVALLLIFNGWKTAIFSRMINLLTEGYLELPLWTLQMLLPLGGALLLPVVALQVAQTLTLWLRLPEAHDAQADGARP
ncbi:TRAP transporter small permease [Limimaricola pyoseonensis]|uniref:TRAP transporter small permease protein n=1 Tax=Limimaricola pyoseonensis TaxID=521013 RepID=A0A1G7G2U3_9RHOB|nr:TRAP transporter small permease subunit [Limimaricola pyoseonensis]SDE82428.1 TRAP-type C4-dicarboxylate transport system, small permease component [Limimaricola pyoseonensis]